METEQAFPPARSRHDIYSALFDLCEGTETRKLHAHRFLGSIANSLKKYMYERYLAQEYRRRDAALLLKQKTHAYLAKRDLQAVSRRQKALLFLQQHALQQKMIVKKQIALDFLGGLVKRARALNTSGVTPEASHAQPAECIISHVPEEWDSLRPELKFNLIGSYLPLLGCQVPF